MTELDGFTFRAFMDLFAALTLAVGLFFMVVGAVGVHRLPDAYNRIHAASICITLGITCMLLSACYHIGSLPIIAKALATITFMFVAGPIGSHMLAKAAHHGKLPQWERTLSDDLAEDKLDPRMAASDDPASVGQSSGPRVGPRPPGGDPFERSDTDTQAA